jgi:hypothetical protein
VHGCADSNPQPAAGGAVAWSVGIEFLRAVAARDYAGAGTLLDDASARDGIGEVNGALSDAGRALLDLVVFEAGTIDVLDVVAQLADRAVELAGAAHVTPQQLRALIVFLGSEGLPCAARSEVTSWSPLDRRDALVTLVAGLAAWAALQRGCGLAELADELEPPVAVPPPALGTFGLAWRGTDGGPLALQGTVPPGYAPHITFLGVQRCTLRAVFARVAYLREPRPGSDAPRQRIDAFVNSPR